MSEKIKYYRDRDIKHWNRKHWSNPSKELNGQTCSRHSKTQPISPFDYTHDFPKGDFEKKPGFSGEIGFKYEGILPGVPFS